MNNRTLIILVFITFITSACSSDKETANNEGFWPWFQSRDNEFAELFSYETQSASQNDSSIREKTKSTVKEIGDNLRKINAEFSPFFGFSDGSNQMIITVHGQAKHFDAVDDFIASAPVIKGWRFIALKQPLALGAETEIRSGTTNLKVGDFRYSKSKNKNGLFNISIYLPAKISDDPKGFERLFTRLTMDFLGERFSSTVIGDISVHELTNDSPDALLPFVDIYADFKRPARNK